MIQKTARLCVLFGLILFVSCSANMETESVKSWIKSLPQDIQDAILWSAEHEDGSFEEWEDAGTDDYYAGGGIFITDPENAFVTLTNNVAHSGDYSAKAKIQEAYRAENGNKAVRLMRWTDKAWNEEGDYFPDTAYYSVWMYIPFLYNPNKYPPWDPGDGGWWNVFQFKSDDEKGISQPIWVLNVAFDEDENEMFFYLYSKYNAPYSFERKIPLSIPVGKWFHIEAKYVKSSYGEADGEIVIWQDGVELFRLPNVITQFSEQTSWGIGNYSDHITGGDVPGSASLYFDDAVVSSLKVF